jgi:hypothetical protein
MTELRSAQRSSVSWRAAIKLGTENIVPAKIVNIANNGVQLQCAYPLRDNQSYQMMMEVPGTSDASQRTQVVCTVNCMYTILSGGEYRAGLKFLEVAPQHKQLLHNWGIKTTV